ncbi:MAG: hypothetical protein V2I97_17895 [Desulfococcaceae bacterium]|nr:hypothetical protein [Desulfococcaceae bacterium]
MNELERQIMNQTKGLPPVALAEIFDFIEFVRYKKSKGGKKLPHIRSYEENYLKIMEKNELHHLEHEFMNYRELYPYEEITGESP